MEDREEKLSKAREKLDKFRKKKQKNPESVVSVVGDEGQSKESSSTSPEVLQAPDQVSQDQQHPTNKGEESFVSCGPALDSAVSSEASGPADQSSLASYFGSSGSETVQQFYIGEGEYHRQCTTLQYK